MRERRTRLSRPRWLKLLNLNGYVVLANHTAQCTARLHELGFTSGHVRGLRRTGPSNCHTHLDNSGIFQGHLLLPFQQGQMIDVPYRRAHHAALL